MSIVPGTTVMLKSGGPIMTVTAMKDGETVICQWFDAEQKNQVAAFPIVAVKPYESGY